MNMALSTFMKIAITAIVIGALIFGLMIGTLKEESKEYKNHMKDNMNEVIKSELNK